MSAKGEIKGVHSFLHGIEFKEFKDVKNDYYYCFVR